MIDLDFRHCTEHGKSLLESLSVECLLEIINELKRTELQRGLIFAGDFVQVAIYPKQELKLNKGIWVTLFKKNDFCYYLRDAGTMEFE